MSAEVFDELKAVTEAHNHSLNFDATVFMIDDDPLILELYETYLTEAGYTNLFSFADSVVAIERLSTQTPDLILTDVQMPDVSGNYLVRLIRTYPRFKKVPIVAITSDTSDETQDKILKAGASALAYKPLDATKLTAIVSTALKSTRIRTQQLSMVTG